MGTYPHTQPDGSLAQPKVVCSCRVNSTNPPAAAATGWINASGLNVLFPQSVTITSPESLEVNVNGVWVIE